MIEVVDETADTKTFVLAPNRRWPGHVAGQYVPVELEIGGVRVRRCYSISSGGSRRGAQRISITVRRVPGGRVSSFLHDHIKPGAIVRLGMPAGELTVPADVPAKLLLVAGGSGITPVIAIVRDLVARGAAGDIVVVHAARGEADAIFAGALAALPIRVVPHRGGLLDAVSLHALVPDLATRETYACGPTGLLAVVDQALTAVGAAHRLHVERFTPTLRAPPPASGSHRVTLGARSLVLAGDRPLLVELEDAGLRPPHGCRMGICNTCRCRKHTGTVLDLATGAVSSEPDQEIRLCVSIAQSDLELAVRNP